MVVELTLRLVRHGRTTWNDEHRYCGHADVPLSAAGREELVPLPATEYRSVWSSDLRRCRDTATALGLRPVCTADLREFDFGEIEGATWDTLDATIRTALLDYESFAAPGGETVAEFAARVEGFVDSLPAGHHLLVTHGGVIQHLLWRAGDDRRVAPGEWIDLAISRR